MADWQKSSNARSVYFHLDCEVLEPNIVVTDYQVAVGFPLEKSLLSNTYSNIIRPWNSGTTQATALSGRGWMWPSTSSIPTSPNWSICLRPAAWSSSMPRRAWPGGSVLRRSGTGYR